MDQRPRCKRCGEPISLWESMVVWADGVARWTSALNERVIKPMGTYYHGVCFRALQNEESSDHTRTTPGASHPG